MSDSFSHWQHTDEDEQPVHIRTQPHQPEAAEAVFVPVSRRPAALVGIALVACIAFAYLGGLQQLLGQTATDEADILLEVDGPNPPSFEVTPGGSITWENTLDIPQILTSETLELNDGTFLRTSPIFSGDSVTVELASDLPLGTYPYFSLTDSELGGVIVVTNTPSAPERSSSPAIQQASSQQSVPVVVPTVPSSSSSSSSSSIATLPPTAQPSTGVPENPFRVGSTIADGSDKGTTAQTPPLASTTGKPATQPASGPGLWVAIAISMGLIWLVGRHTAIGVRDA